MSARAFTRQIKEEREHGGARPSEDVSDIPAGGVSVFTRKYQTYHTQMHAKCAH